MNSFSDFSMIEFNEDGSIKLPARFQQAKDEKEQRMKNSRCIKIKKEIVSDISPKKCVLRLILSDRLYDNRFVETTYGYFRNRAEVPTKLSKVNEKEFEIEIGTCFRRCSDCNSLVGQFREFMDGNCIVEKGSCSFEPNRNFCYEDYFE